MESINDKMTILEVISKYRDTEAVFRRYDQYAGTCLCCEALFDPLWKVAEQYNLDLEKLLADLRQVVKVC